MEIEDQIRQQLFAQQDVKYREFQSRLMPTVEKDRIIGVRVPRLRELAKQIRKLEEWERYLSCLPHQYYEEDNLHGFLIESVEDYDTCIALLNQFLPYVDNWATCDMVSPKVLGKHLPQLNLQIREWIKSGSVYTVRYGIGMLLRYFLDDAFESGQLNIVTEICSREYYINMMIAWYLATALAKQWDSTIGLLEKQELPVWIHNKTIQKAVESKRICPQHKEYLKTLRKL